MLGGLTQGFALGYLMRPFQGQVHTARLSSASGLGTALLNIAQQHDFIPVNPLAAAKFLQATHQNADSLVLVGD